jgi:hypothetical protein
MSTLVIDDISATLVSIDLVAKKIQTTTFLHHNFRESISCAVSEIGPETKYLTLDELRKIIYKYGNCSISCVELAHCLLP